MSELGDPMWPSWLAAKEVYAPPNSGHYVGKGRQRTRTRDDCRAKWKRVQKRRKAKGYK